MVICLEQGADLHMAQLMPLPLTVSCFTKIQIGCTFWYRLTRVVPDKGPLNRCVCVVDDDVFLIVQCSFMTQYCVERRGRYLQGDDFEVFRLAGVTHCSDGDEIWHGRVN